MSDSRQPHRGHGNPLHGQQGQAGREDRRAGARKARGRHLRHARRVRPRGHAHRHRAEKATSTPRWCSTTSTSTRRCRRPSAPTCWRWWTASRASLNLQQIIYHYLEHQKRRGHPAHAATTSTRPRPAAHILEGLLIALDHIDEIVAAPARLRARSRTPPRTALWSASGLSEQAGAGHPGHAPGHASPAWSARRLDAGVRRSCKRPIA